MTNKKTKKESMPSFYVTYEGEARVEAYSYESARRKLETMKNIKTSRPIKTKSLLRRAFEGYVVNFSDLIVLIFFISFFKVWIDLLGLITSLEIKALSIFAILLMSTMLMIMLHSIKLFRSTRRR